MPRQLEKAARLTALAILHPLKAHRANIAVVLARQYDYWANAEEAKLAPGYTAKKASETPPSKQLISHYRLRQSQYLDLARKLRGHPSLAG